MRLHVLTFAGIREIVGTGSLILELPAGARLSELWAELVARHPALAPLEFSTRLSRNGSLVDRSTPLGDGDEVAVMPPFGGG